MNIMAKIYRRDNLVSGVTPKEKNEKNRKRSVIVNCRINKEADSGETMEKEIKILE